MEINFSIRGEFITNMAREKFFQGNDLSAAINILTGALQTDQLTPNQITMLALQILNGDAEIKGTYPGDDYGITFNEDIDENDCSLENITGLFAQLSEKKANLEKEYNDLLHKYLFVCSALSDYELDDLNVKYYNETDESLFPDIKIPAYKKCKVIQNDSTELESFLEQKRREKEYDTDEDYGWLAPDGTYYPVAWSGHEAWASEYLEKHYPYKENADLYWMTSLDGQKQHICGGDVLIHSLHWVLIDNPYQGKGNPHYDERWGLTNAQRDFLYDYFIERDRHDEANQLYKG